MADESDDYYQTGGSSKSSESESDEDAGPETALLPKSFFGSKDLEVGKKCEVEIVSKFDDEIEVKYVEHKKDGDKDGDKDDKKERKDSDKSDAAPGTDDDAQASIERGISRMEMM